MLTEVQKKWVAALRSGEYKQGRARLRWKDDTFCCLGVLCDLAVKEKVIPPPTLRGGQYLYCDDYDNILPPEVERWARLFSAGGSYTITDTFGCASSTALYTDNDLLEKSFNQIADIIESEPEGLFTQGE